VHDCHVITHALLLIRATPFLPFSRLMRATQTCWLKRDVFQQKKTHPLNDIWLNYLIDLVRAPPTLYQVDDEVNTVRNK
jgi:hypothetical protein